MTESESNENRHNETVGVNEKASNEGSDTKKRTSVTRNKTKRIQLGGSPKTKNTVSARNSIFDPRDNLISLLRNEKSFKLQVFSLEPVEIFEDFLVSQKIEYYKTFTSMQEDRTGKIVILLEDQTFEKLIEEKVILYSNKRRMDFLPYKFKLSAKEKKALESIKNIPNLASGMIDVCTYTANSLSYIQCVIIMALIKARNLKGITKEVTEIDPSLNNSFLIGCELAYLENNGYCERSGDRYSLCVSQETVKLICERIGFKNVPIL